MPEWEKAAIAAGIGSLFGAVGNVLMEYVRPLIAEKRLAKQMTAQLVDEMKHNVGALNGYRSFTKNLSIKDRYLPDENVMNLFRLDRFDHYFGSHKEALYNLKGSADLRLFYDRLKTPPSQLPIFFDWTKNVVAVYGMIDLGKRFLIAHRAKDIPADDEAYHADYKELLRRDKLPD
jgi:hypothetical protein